MSEFRVEEIGEDGYGRLGTLDIPHGSVDTPALFPVINLIGGTTTKSGGVWRRMRDNLIEDEHLQGIMFQAMSFTDYGVSPDNLNNFWRQQTFHERFPDLDAPVFIDSGGFKLMNSNTFGAAPKKVELRTTGESTRIRKAFLDCKSTSGQTLSRRWTTPFLRSSMMKKKRIGWNAVSKARSSASIFWRTPNR